MRIGAKFDSLPRQNDASVSSSSCSGNNKKHNCLGRGKQSTPGWPGLAFFRHETVPQITTPKKVFHQEITRGCSFTSSCPLQTRIIKAAISLPLNKHNRHERNPMTKISQASSFLFSVQAIPTLAHKVSWFSQIFVLEAKDLALWHSAYLTREPWKPILYCRNPTV